MTKKRKISAVELIMKNAGWISVSEAVRLSGFSKFTIHRYISVGKVLATQAGKRWFVDRQSLADCVGADPLRRRILGETEVCSSK